MSELSFDEVLYGFQRPTKEEAGGKSVVFYWVARYVDIYGELVRTVRVNSLSEIDRAALRSEEKLEVSLVRDQIGYDELWYADVNRTNHMLDNKFKDGGDEIVRNSQNNVPYQYMREFVDFAMRF